jgi:hypothetical protein
MVGGAVCLSSNIIRFGSFADIGKSVMSTLPLKADIRSRQTDDHFRPMN